MSKRSQQDNNRFDINADGTVTDIVSGLTWLRCSVGQRWDSDRCKGEAEPMSWGRAYSAPNTFSKVANGKSDQLKWRLPTVNELATIVDINCYSPRINLTLFPNTVASKFWTSNSAPGSPQEAFTLSFGNSLGNKGIGRNQKSEKHYVRLVRGRE